MTRPFDPPAQPWLSGHRGVDLGATPGASVTAVEDGVVIYAGVLVNRPVISIRHANGLRSTYEPVDPKVQAGQSVGHGETIGVSQAGHDSGALHLGAKWDSTHYIDPLFLLLPPVALKPW